MNDEDRKNIVRQLLNRVYGISSREYQERVWLKALRSSNVIAMMKRFVVFLMLLQM
jgi:hypothetical protein